MSEIAWRPWSDEAFAEAQTQEKPVLLSITAPWCQFCRAMDEQTYANDAIASFVEDNFIPIRVDSDKRPEINSRYTQGGWPTTCILTGEGDLLWGGTSLPAEHMAQLLPQVLNSFRHDKAGLQQHVNNLRQQLKEQNTPPPLDRNSEVRPTVPLNILMAAKFEFDFAFGGFGHNGQKFPHVDTIELVMEHYSRSAQAGSPDADMKLILDRTLLGIAEGEMHDAADGGFFRYAQTPDWRAPQVEKLLEDNAALARTFVRAYQLLGDNRWKGVAEKTVAYLKTHLYDPERGVFGGSQFADAEYYAQPVEERKEWNPPAVDATVYAGPNAVAARALFAWWQATGDAETLAAARRTVDFILINMVREGVVTRWLGEAAEPSPAGLLADSADVAAVCIDLYEAGQGIAYLDAAEAIANWARGHLEDPVGGGLFDHPIRNTSTGNLKIGNKDIADNMVMADCLLRLFLATGETEHAGLAQRILQALQVAAQQMGFLAAPLGLAIDRASLPPLIVRVLGPTSDPRTQALIAAAHRPYRFDRFVQPLDPTNEEDLAYIQDLEYEVPEEPIAHLMLAADPLAPTVDPETLTETIRTASL